MREGSVSAGGGGSSGGGQEKCGGGRQHLSRCVGKSTSNRPPTPDARRSLWATSDSGNLDATKTRLVSCDVLDWCLETSRAKKNKTIKKRKNLMEHMRDVLTRPNIHLEKL